MFRPIGALAVASCGLLLLGSAVPARPASVRTPLVQEVRVPPAPVALAARDRGAAPAPAAPSPPSPPSPRQALQDGVLIVVSIASQRMFVFRDGELWDSSPVSTGRRGHETPTGVFPILQKRVHHRSNLYDDAPMPYMQRLTWGGIALHAGHVPGHPASHGCIRLPTDLAQRLYAITDFTKTVVLIADEPLGSVEEARARAGGGPVPPTLAQTRDDAPRGPTQTIQLAAAESAGEAAELWQQLVYRRPELQQLTHTVIPAIVHDRQYYRLRASGPAAHALCTRLASSGVDCLKVS